MQNKPRTPAQERLMKWNGLIPDHWMVVRDDRYRLLLIHRESMRHKTILKGRKNAR